MLIASVQFGGRASWRRTQYVIYGTQKSVNEQSDLVAMDVSADLPELTRCPVGLVSAGVKSILDIGR